MQVALVDYRADDAPAVFARALRETGFAILVDHPITDGLVQRTCDEWLAFFSTDAKDAYRHAEGDQDGYVPPPDVGETTSRGLVRDRKEFFHIYSGRRYPSEVSNAALLYLEEAKALSAALIDWLDKNTPADVVAGLSMPLSKMIEGSSGTVLRVQHYLPMTGGEPSGALRALAHEDINLITLLPAPSQPGLQVRGLDGTWHDIPFEPRSMIVNSGEMLQLACRDYYPATPHRVVNPTDMQSKGSRVSLPLFVHPTSEVILAPGRTASSFLQERIDALRAKGWGVVPGGKGVRP
jgi:isopenicillin N synthase-like dioxygenase